MCTVEFPRHSNENYIYRLHLRAVKQLQVSWSVKRLNSAHKRPERQEEEFIQTVVQLWWVETDSVFCSAIFDVAQSDDNFGRKTATERFVKVREKCASSQQTQFIFSDLF